MQHNDASGYFNQNSSGERILQMNQIKRHKIHGVIDKFTYSTELFNPVFSTPDPVRSSFSSSSRDVHVRAKY
jgi:hypothetical protein